MESYLPGINLPNETISGTNNLRQTMNMASGTPFIIVTAKDNSDQIVREFRTVFISDKLDDSTKIKDFSGYAVDFNGRDVLTAHENEGGFELKIYNLALNSTTNIGIPEGVFFRRSDQFIFKSIPLRVEGSLTTSGAVFEAYEHNPNVFGERFLPFFLIGTGTAHGFIE